MLARLLAGFGPREVLLVLGLALVATGLAMVYVPAALIVPGAVLTWLAVTPLRPSRRI